MVIEFVCVLFLTLCLIENFHGFCLFPWKVVFSWRVGITFLCLLRGGKKKKHFRGSICVGCNYRKSNWVLNVLQSVSPAETSIFYCKFLFVSLESDSPRKKKRPLFDSKHDLILFVSPEVNFFWEKTYFLRIGQY